MVSQLQERPCKSVIFSTKKHKTLQKQHTTIQKQHKTLQKKHKTLQKQHKTIQKQHKTIQKHAPDQAGRDHGASHFESFGNLDQQIDGNSVRNNPIVLGVSPVFIDISQLLIGNQELLIGNQDSSIENWQPRRNEHYTSNSKINRHFSTENHRFAGEVLRSFYIFNGKLKIQWKTQNVFGVYIAIRHTPGRLQQRVKGVRICKIYNF